MRLETKCMQCGEVVENPIYVIDTLEDELDILCSLDCLEVYFFAEGRKDDNYN